MNWLVLVGVLATAFVATAQVSAVPGTCASIGYSNACCPPDQVCQASDGDCYCNANCHTFGDCCQDVHCPSQPRTCSAIGITTCCEDVQNNGNCDVHFRDSQENRCSCNISCYLRNDCCSDVSAIGCIPQTCTEAGKNPGGCVWSPTTSCFIFGGRCYCDSYCRYFDDCCDDVSSAMSQWDYAQLSRNRQKNKLKKELKSSIVQKLSEGGRRTQRIRYANTKFAYQRDQPAQRSHMRARARAHATD